MSISEAIKNRDMAELKKTVDAATALYKAGKPAEVNIETVHGQVPVSVVFNEDDKWNVITSAYVTILNEVKSIPADLDVETETAKLIATNAILRNVVDPSAGTAAPGGLL